LTKILSWSAVAWLICWATLGSGSVAEISRITIAGTTVGVNFCDSSVGVRPRPSWLTPLEASSWPWTSLQQFPRLERRHRLALLGLPQPDEESSGGDVDEFCDAGEVAGVPRIEPGAVRMGSGGDEQVHDPTSRLTAGVDDCGREATVADRDCLVDG